MCTAAVYSSFRHNMRVRTHKQVLIVLAHYLFLVCAAQVGGVFVGSFLKSVAFLAFAFLLLFVVGRSANLWKAITTCLRALPISFFALFTNPDWKRTSAFTLVVPAEPCLAPRYQRPPPLLSF
jgi:hypothetical protein